METPAAIGQTATLDDIEMYYEVRGDGSPLILLHGFTGSGGDWAHVFDLTALSRERRLIVPDLRGHGRSTNPSTKFTHRACALDVFTLLDRLGIHEFDAIGMSLGGNTLIHMSTQQPDRVRAMVLVSATPYFPEQARAIMRGMTAEERSAEEWEILRARHVHGDDQIRALVRHGAGFAESYEDMNFTGPYLSTIKARTMIVYGDRDPLYPVEIAVEMYRAIPRSALWVVPGGGHGPIFGDAQKAFAPAAIAFLIGEDRGAPVPRTA
jgi:pimeloyl-ACP methyl ester carboxylesterase